MDDDGFAREPGPAATDPRIPKLPRDVLDDLRMTAARGAVRGATLRELMLEGSGPTAVDTFGGVVAEAFAGAGGDVMDVRRLLDEDGRLLCSSTRFLKIVRRAEGDDRLDGWEVRDGEVIETGGG